MTISRKHLDQGADATQFPAARRRSTASIPRPSAVDQDEQQVAENRGVSSGTGSPRAGESDVESALDRSRLLEGTLSPLRADLTRPEMPDWLGYHLSQSVDSPDAPEIKEALAEIVRRSCGEETTMATTADSKSEEVR